MLLILMGVSGSGKTCIGLHLAEILQWPFLDGDDFHPAENVAKMGQGIPLTDQDRDPWLRAIAGQIKGHESPSLILACSALKAVYRRVLVEECGRDEDVQFVHLQAEENLLRKRLESRKDHYFKPKLLKSQLDTLESPECDEQVLTINVDETKNPEKVAREIIDRLHLRKQ